MKDPTETNDVHGSASTATMDLAPEITVLPSELSELFLAEMNSRRERLNYWLGLIHEAAAHVEASAVRSKPPRSCRGRRSPRNSH